MTEVSSDGLKEFAVSLGFQNVGICLQFPPSHLEAYRSWVNKGYHGEMAYLAHHAAIKADPSALLPGVRSIVACALNYYQDPSERPGEARIARYALGRDYHRVIRTKLRRLSEWIETEHSGAKCRACVDSAPVMERDYAQMAGLGFFGKNTMLIDARRGSWFFIGLLLTTVRFAPDRPTFGSCGSCTKCIDACPTGAIVFEDERWQLDARKCISYLTIEKQGDIDLSLQSQIGQWTFGCDVCQEVCPFNKERESQPLRSNRFSDPDFSNRWEGRSLQNLASTSYEDWDEMTQGSAVRRAGYEGIRRNATINLKNAATSETDSE